MSTFIDKALLAIAFTLGGFVVASYITDSYLFGLLIVSLLVIIFVLCIQLVNKKDEGILSKKEYWRMLLIEGKDYIQNAVFEVFSVYYETKKIDGSIIINVNERQILIYNAFRFGVLGEEDVASSYRLAKSYDIEEIYLFYNQADRRALALSNSIPQKVKLLTYRNFYRIAKGANKLPTVKKQEKKSRKWGLIAKSVLSYVNIKLFLFAGISTAILSFLTPLRLYYLIFSAINIILAAVIFYITRKEEKILF